MIYYSKQIKHSENAHEVSTREFSATEVIL